MLADCWGAFWMRTDDLAVAKVLGAVSTGTEGAVAVPLAFSFLTVAVAMAKVHDTASSRSPAFFKQA